jgi:hypothetical protein
VRAMRRFAVSVIFRLGLTGAAAWSLASRAQATRGRTARALTARALTARALTARAATALRAAVLGLMALAGGTTAVLAPLAAGTAPARASVAIAPRDTLASVVPSTAIPQSRVTFSVDCTSSGATSATLIGSALGLTEHIRMRPNRAAGGFAVSVTLPASIRPGTYRPGIKCSDGTATTARLLVPAFAAAGSTWASVGRWLTVAGLILIGSGAVTRSIVLRRRHARNPDLADNADQADHADETAVSEHSGRFDYSSHSNFRFFLGPQAAARVRNHSTRATAVARATSP